MLARAYGVTLLGLEAHLVEVEVDVGPGLPGFHLVGLPDASVQEARERVRTAIRNSGFEFPARRITVNLAPADLRKEGPGLDLAIALPCSRPPARFRPSPWPNTCWWENSPWRATSARSRGCL